MLLQTVFVGGQYLGSSHRYPLNKHSTLQKPISFACFCPVCGDVWARVVIPDTKFFCYHIACSKHHYDGSPTAGSLWITMEQDFIDTMPFEVLKRELLLHIDNYERSLNGNAS